MPTTTNYGWTTPADTDLVKDGASAIRTLGTAIDTTTKNLNPETTLGDIAYRSSTANTNTRLALGTAGQVLTVNSGATAPEWSTLTVGGMTLISTTSLSGATVTLSSIPSTYKDLILIVYGMTNATGNGRFRIAPNAVTNGCQQVFSEATTTSIEASTVFNNDYIQNAWARSMLRTDANNAFNICFFDYANGSSYKTFSGSYGGLDLSSNQVVSNFGGIFRSNTAISSLALSNAGGNLSTGTALLYGVK
jgi:hypothetical protein